MRLGCGHIQLDRLAVGRLRLLELLAPACQEPAGCRPDWVDAVANCLSTCLPCAITMFTPRMPAPVSDGALSKCYRYQRRLERRPAQAYRLEMTELHIPEGIHYECTGCGNCCLAWPVPVTAEDQERIAGLHVLHAASRSSASLIASGASDLSLEPIRQLSSGELFRPLRSAELKLKGFTHTLEKRADGRCEFLTEDNRCWLHLNYGPESKPAMCQLFPYTFTETPSGVYASVSFASTGALMNSGRALCEQRDVLSEHWQLFTRLFPELRLDWSQIQLVDGHHLSWDAYLELEKELFSLVRSPVLRRVDKRLMAGSRYLIGQLPRGTNLERLPKMEARPKMVDQLLLKHLLALYLPDDVFAQGLRELDVQSLLKELVAPPDAVHVECSGQKFGFQQLRDFQLGDLEAASEDLLARFIYCRIFAKLYFGAGLANLSLIAGLHHLILLIVLIRLRIKIIALSQGLKTLDFLAVAEVLRALERRLSQTVFSKESTAILEVLLISPERLERLTSLAS